MEYLHLCIFLENNIFIVESICIMKLEFANPPPLTEFFLRSLMVSFW